MTIAQQYAQKLLDLVEKYEDELSSDDMKTIEEVAQLLRADNHE